MSYRLAWEVDEAKLVLRLLSSDDDGGEWVESEIRIPLAALRGETNADVE